MSIYNAEIYLKTKLIHPQIRSNRVLRGRLIERLGEAFTVPLTLVCAPAGYGKTTLLVDWAQSCRARVAWLTLDEDDNDPVRFLAYLILAVQQIDPALGKSVQVLLGFSEENLLDNCLRLLINDLADLSEPVVLVLDDYHWVIARPVHQMVDFLVKHLPPNFHVVISSRTEPGIALARLRARSSVLELRATDLSFRPEETEEFLRQVMQLNLSTAFSSQLLAQTEGWAAGLQLAALSLQGREGSLPADAAHSGQHYIFEYLADEVLSRLPTAMRRFLTCTAILDQLSGPLCDALVDPFPPYASGAECLDALEHANLFTQVLDEERNWFRYHALFADFLRERLKKNETDQISSLHARAARWLAGQGNFEQACKHALIGKDQDLLVWLIETYAQSLERQGNLPLLARWINVLPEEVVRAHPRVCLAQAWLYAAKLDVKGASVYLDLAGQQVSGANTPEVRAEILAAQAFLAGVDDRAEELYTYTDEAFRLLPDKNHFLYGLLKINLSFPHILSGRLDRSIQLLEDGIAAGFHSNSMIIVLLGMRILGEAYLVTGRINQAENTFLQALEYIEASLGKNSPVRGMALMGLGEVYRRRNELKKAEQYLIEGLEKTMTWMPAMGMDGFLWLSALKQAMGQPVEAQMQLQQARQVCEATAYTMLDSWFIASAEVKLDLVQGYLEKVLRWARGTGLDLDTLENLDQFFGDAPRYYRTIYLYILAHLFLILGRNQGRLGELKKAAIILDRVQPVSEEAGAFTFLLEGLLMYAQVEQARGNEEAAQQYLQRALNMAAPERPVRLFLDEGEPLKVLLIKRSGQSLPAEERVFVDLLLRAWGEEKGISLPEVSQKSTLIEPLSFRELEVLRRMAEGQSNREIADGLVLSLNTVKKHVSTIMSKLQAKNRFQAVLVARQVGLISEN